MPKLTIYTTATCGYCRMLKSYLKQQDVDFDEKKADEDHDLAKELYMLSGQLAVPFTVVEQDDGTKSGVLGFNKLQFDEILGLN